MRAVLAADALVGRGAELAAIRAMLRADRPGARLLAVTGDPGIGKTHLLATLSAAAADRGLPVISAAATEFERHLPFGALTEALGNWLRGGVQSVARFEPPVRALLADLSTADGRNCLGLHRRIRSVLEELAEPHGLVLVLDDLHWADPAMLDLVGYLVHRPPRGRWVLTLAFRQRQVDQRVEEALCTAGYAERLDLGPLSRAECGQLLGSRVGVATGDALFRESGGNPLFLKALHRAGTAGPAATPTGVDDLPPTVHAALTSELHGLPAGAARVARAAAVAGDPFQYDLVAAIAGVDEPAAARLVDELVERDVVRQVAPAPRFSFRHPLVRRVIYTTMSASARRDAHGRAALELERADAAPLVRAHHVARSARPGDRTAAELLADAARTTLFQAPATAAWLLEESLRILPAGRDDPSARQERRLALSRALILTGRLADGRDVAHRLLGQLPDDAVSMRAEAAIVTATADRLLGRHKDGRAVLCAELDRLRGADHPAAVSILLELVTNGLLAGDFDPERRDILDAVAAADRIGDRSLKAAAATVLAFASYTTGRYPDAVRQLDVATSLVDALGPDDLAARLDVVVWLAWTELFLERYHLAVDRFDRALDLMRTVGQGHLLTYAMVGKAQALVQCGELDRGVEWAYNAVEAATATTSDELHTMAYTLLCLATTYTGDLETALAAGARAVAAAGPVADWWAASAGILLAQARLAAGADPARCVEEMLAAGGGPHLCRLDPANRPFIYQSLVLAELARGAPDAALSWVDRADAVVARLGPAAAARAATAALLRAKVLVRAGQPAAAAEHARRAVSGFTKVGKRFFLGRAELTLGRALVASGQGADGLVHLRQAQTIFTSIGAHRFADQSIRAQRKLGRRAAAGPGSIALLTEREAEIAVLVADGHTNRKIAERLVLSERTVETHVRNIRTKLDLTSRTAIAMVIARAGTA